MSRMVLFLTQWLTELMLDNFISIDCLSHPMTQLDPRLTSTGEKQRSTRGEWSFQFVKTEISLAVTWHGSVSLNHTCPSVWPSRVDDHRKVLTLRTDEMLLVSLFHIFCSIWFYFTVFLISFSVLLPLHTSSALAVNKVHVFLVL